MCRLVHLYCMFELSQDEKILNALACVGLGQGSGKLAGKWDAVA
jgi:hypothetical protein